MSLKDRIEDFIDNFDEIRFTIVLISLILGTADRHHDYAKEVMSKKRGVCL